MKKKFLLSLISAIALIASSAMAADTTDSTQGKALTKPIPVTVTADTKTMTPGLQHTKNGDMLTLTGPDGSKLTAPREAWIVAMNGPFGKELGLTTNGKTVTTGKYGGDKQQ